MGYHIAPKTVADIMHKNGWFSVRAGAKKLYEQGQKRFVNHVCQQFDVSEPNKVWASDVTEIKYNGFKYYICVVLDLFSRKVLACTISIKEIPINPLYEEPRRVLQYTLMLTDN